MSSRDPGSVLCRYFSSGCCYRADCPFSHDRSTPADNICRYYLQGNCFYGNSCRYDHDRNVRQTVADTGNNGFCRTSVEPVKPKPKMTSPRHLVHSAINEEAAVDRPPPVSYAQAVDYSATPLPSDDIATSCIAVCQYAMVGICPVGDSCQNWHGDLCEVCQCQVLDPNDPVQRSQHEEACAAAFEKDMEYSFAVQRSQEKACSICMETVLDQADETKRRFGILENCTHPFCFECIMKWRKQSRETLDPKAIRSCPECRVHSDYVIPSLMWPETEKHKTEIITAYKKQMGKRPCKHYNQGRGTCPFGGKCWFLHALPDGTPVTLPDPKPRRRVVGSRGVSLPTTYVLADFMDLSDEDSDDDIFYGDDDYFLSDEDEYLDDVGWFHGRVSDWRELFDTIMGRDNPYRVDRGQPSNVAQTENRPPSPPDVVLEAVPGLFEA
ncbi:probable E3 ubiquitin-protein ligase makorin-1 [Paramacrobiotus metropolitanus]|uniref:probable E3 ubiquitin-protein ligase makorin-1 n=1 Tax=Paramacrobiotus metropolitanus TaxID=2943436 RepID=UPI0024465333|nr:probable E3 ubiquitin-protein ligase makorin-1 [Paramacrobiotus metropolitanus]